MKFIISEIHSNSWEIESDTGDTAKIKYIGNWDIYKLYINGEYNYSYSRFEYCLEAFKAAVTNTEGIIYGSV